jgi:hypothetical protein
MCQAHDSSSATASRSSNPYPVRPYPRGKGADQLRIDMTDTKEALRPNLHGQIMNLEYRDEEALNAEYSDRRIAYKSGHRDARHAAAELAVDADQRIEALATQVEALRAAQGPIYRLLPLVVDCLAHGQTEAANSLIGQLMGEIDAARAALQG